MGRSSLSMVWGSTTFADLASPGEYEPSAFWRSSESYIHCCTYQSAGDGTVVGSKRIPPKAARS
mgnify:CR=1 FL=1